MKSVSTLCKVKDGMTIKCFASTNAFWITPQGNLAPCARFKSLLTDHITDFEDFSLINKTGVFKEARNSLDAGIWPDSCKRCKADEENNIRSKRQYYDAVPMLAPDDFMIDISMGNFCNLKCRMCNPQNSTLWIEDWNSLVKNNIKPKDNWIDEAKGYILNDKDIEKICSFLSTIKGNIFMELKGGEPLIMPHTEKLLSRILETDVCDRITMLIVTNGTAVPKYIEEAAAKFKELQLIVSIDGKDEVYDYIRGVKKFTYADCIENIKKFSKIKNINLRFNVVVQNLNIHQIHDLHQELIKYTSGINYITLNMPQYLAVNNMPDKSKQQIFDDYQKNADSFGNFKDRLDKIHNLMMQPSDPDMYKKFLEFNLHLDKVRLQNGTDLFPHLFKEISVND